MGPCPVVIPKNCLPRRGISVLEKLIKTCPVWLQLGLSRAEAARILLQEAAGVSRVLFTLRPVVGRHSCKEPPGLPPKQLSSAQLPVSACICFPFLGWSAFRLGSFFQNSGVRDWRDIWFWLWKPGVPPGEQGAVAEHGGT